MGAKKELAITIRRMIADCFAFVRDHDEQMLEALKEGFQIT